MLSSILKNKASLSVHASELFEPFGRPSVPQCHRGPFPSPIEPVAAIRTFRVFLSSSRSSSCSPTAGFAFPQSSSTTIYQCKVLIYWNVTYLWLHVDDVMEHGFSTASVRQYSSSQVRQLELFPHIRMAKCIFDKYTAMILFCIVRTALSVMPIYT